MYKFPLISEKLLFVILIVISLIAIIYYFYKAAFRFDPYYNFETNQEKNRIIND